MKVAASHFHVQLLDSAKDNRSNNSVATATGNRDDATSDWDDATMTQRARRSEIEKKSRQRRKGSLQVMRNEVKRLEREYLRLVSGDATMSHNYESNNERGVVLTSPQAHLLRLNFWQLSSETATLRHEQQQLHKVLHVHQLFHDSCQTLATEGARAASDPRVNAVHYAKVVPLAPATCFATMCDAYDVITRFEAGQDFVTTGASLFGWSDRRCLENDASKMIFCFRKIFETQNCDRLMHKCWRTFSDVEFMRRVIFSSKVEVDLEILQVVSQDALVVRRHTTYRTMGCSFHTVYLLFRLQTANGYTVCFRTMPAPEIQQALGENEAWIDLFHWTTLSRVPDAEGNLTDCEISFGGSIGANDINFAAHWMLELIMTVVRWENACVAPLFIK